MSRLEERRRRWEAEQERQRAEDLAQAGRIGADFGLGELRTTARYKQARSGRIFISGFFVAIAGLVAGVAFGAADVRYTLAGSLVPELVGAYEAGDPIAAGQWRIGQAGLTRARGNGREDLLPGVISARSSTAVTANSPSAWAAGAGARSACPACRTACSSPGWSSTPPGRTAYR